MTTPPAATESSTPFPLARGTIARRMAAIAAAMLTSAAGAQVTLSPAVPIAGEAAGRSAMEIPIRVDRVPRLVVTLSGRILLDETGHYLVDGEAPGIPTGGLRGPGCPVTISSHTDSNFQTLNGNVQAGFAESEIAAASYVVPAASFPIKFESAEAIFATSNATVQTTTQWSIILYDGPPNTGNIVYQESSMEGILPPIILGPGTAAVNVQVVIDPSDPEQVLFFNAAGTNTISVGYRIDDHHNQTGNPCSTSPPSGSNAFPTTDIGLSQAAGNWLFGLNCGVFGCPPNGGWSTFQNLNFLCRPSGDWIMRMTWSPVNCSPAMGACCLPNGTCDLRTQGDCTLAGGVYQGDNTNCGSVNCPQPTGACCFGTSCLNLTEADCTQAQGTWLGVGSTCAQGNACPIGACCMPDGSCEILNAAACSAAGGIFRGVGSDCGTANCPQPSGACCLSTGGCIVLTEAECAIIPGSAWGGAGTTCADGCRCEADWDQNTQVNSNDISAFLSDWLTSVQQGTLQADFDGSGTVNSNDISAFLSAWLTAVTEGC